MTTWTYPGIVRRVVDGDTLDLDLDLGFHAHLMGRCRLAAVNSPELPTPEGVAAKVFVEGLCPPGCTVTFVSRQLDNYGRPLGTVQLPDGSYLAERLLEAGHAKPYP
ncbi:MAG TPA: thermonuclease family protein [Streptosporangiaceae bacterium]